jgi:hypothetical protein
MIKLLRKLSSLFFTLFICFDLGGCALISKSSPQPGEASQRVNASYVQALVVVKAALKAEPIEFGKTLVDKSSIKLNGTHAGGRMVQIVISKISDSKSNLVVHAGNDQTGQEYAGKILAMIMQYNKPR